jgi:hypothetical protein
VLELSSVRDLIFKGAMGPSAVVFFQYSTEKEKNLKTIVHHISLKPNRHFELFKNIVIQKFDYKKILQKYFYDNDWAWKVFVYGNILDFFFVKRLKSGFENINQVISKYNLHAGQGVQIGGGDRNDASHLVGLPYIDTAAKKKQLRRFYLDIKSSINWTLKKIHRPRDRDVFKPPALLIKKGLTNNFELVSAVSERECVFTDSITAIRGNDKQKTILRSLEGCVNSRLFPYFTLMTGTSAGIEREQAHNENEKFLFPVLTRREIALWSKELEGLIKTYEEEDLKDDHLRGKIEIKEEEFNKELFRLYDFSSDEQDLISYATDISIPSYQGKQHPYQLVKSISDIKPYAQVFYKYFSKRYNTPGEYFKIDIFFEEYFLAMHFQIVNNKPRNSVTLEGLKDNEKFFKVISRLFSTPQKITNDLFMQKDIKGFEKDSFYVIKPNEAKNWHPAVAHLDLMEFVEAILKKDDKTPTMTT